MKTPNDNEWLMSVAVQLESRALALALGQVLDLALALEAVQALVSTLEAVV